MKIRKVLAAAAATAVAVTAFAVSSSAYELNKDLKTGWSISTTIPGSEFSEITEDSVITLTYTADPSLADMPGHEYWVIKPMINDEGWPLIENIKGLTPSEDGSSYTVPVDGTEVKFSLPAESIEHVQIAGIAFMGHGVTLGELTISNDETLPSEAPVEDEAPAAADTDAAGDSDKASPDTGVADVAAIAGLAIVAAGAVALTKKRK